MHVPLGLNFLEPKARVTWILPETSVRLPCLFLDLSRQITKRLTKPPCGSRFQRFSGSSSFVSPRRCSARASSASRASASPDSSNNFDQRRSDSNSLSSHRASSSCASAGSSETRAKASSRSRVMFSSYPHGSAGTLRLANRRPTLGFGGVASPLAAARKLPEGDVADYLQLCYSKTRGHVRCNALMGGMNERRFLSGVIRLLVKWSSQREVIGSSAPTDREPRLR